MFVFNLIRSGAGFLDILMILLALAIAATMSIVLHENAHGFAALKCGDQTAKSRGRLTLNPVAHFDPIGFLMIVLVGFGWAKPVPIDPRNFKDYKKGMFLVSIAGVVTNIALCGFFLLIMYFAFPAIGYYRASDNAGLVLMKEFFYYFLLFLININFMLAFFNLLPVYPLDGFRLLDLYLKPGNKYSAFMYRYGGYVILAIVLLGNVFRATGLQFLDIFYWANRLIQILIDLVTVL